MLAAVAQARVQEQVRPEHMRLVHPLQLRCSVRWRVVHAVQQIRTTDSCNKLMQQIEECYRPISRVLYDMSEDTS